MITDIDVVISAAGMGTRLGLNIPKCLIEYNGKTLLRYQLELLAKFETIYLVVGFKEEQVIEEAYKIRSDIIIVRNPDYAKTSNAYSLHLGSRFSKKFLALDGDILFNKQSFQENIINNIVDANASILFSTNPKTEDSVYMLIDGNENKCIDFSRIEKTNYEWSGCGFYNNIKIPNNEQYVFHAITKYLPLRVVNIICWEVDTPQDLELLKNHGLNIDFDKSQYTHFIISFNDIEQPLYITGRGYVVPLKQNNIATIYNVGDVITFTEYNNIFNIYVVETFIYKGTTIALLLQGDNIDLLSPAYNEWSKTI